MGDFNSMFPNFLTQCLSLKTLLTPIAYLLITGGLIASTIAHHRSGNAQLQAIGKVIVLIMLIVFLPTWGNQIVSIVDDTVKNVLKVDPAKIHDQYQAALQIKKSSDGNTSWWDKLVNFSSFYGRTRCRLPSSFWGGSRARLNGGRIFYRARFCSSAMPCLPFSLGCWRFRRFNKQRA